MESLQRRPPHNMRGGYGSCVFRHRFMRALLLLICSGLVANAADDSLEENLEENESVQRFREYLRIPTVHPEPHYEVAIEWLLKQAADIGLPARTVELVPQKPILYITWEGKDPTLPSILLNSHMDVVAVDREKWKYDPFEAHMEENGDIYARGSQDDKVVGIQHLEAIRRLRSQGYNPTRTIRVIFVPDEEIGGADGWGRFIDSEQFSELNIGVMLDEGHASENNTYHVGYAEKAPWWLVIKAVGESGHGSLLYDGTAMENLQKSYEAIARFRESQFNLVKAGLAEQTDVVSINGAYLKAGTPSGDGFVMNIQPSEAEAGFDIRVPPIAGMGAYLDKRIAEEWAPASRNMTYSFKEKTETESGEPPMTLVDDSNPWWTLLGKAVSVFNATLIPGVSTGSTDSRYVRKKGLPAFGFTPVQNVPFLFHGDNEFMNAWEFLKGIAVFEQVLQVYGSYTGESQVGGDESRQTAEHSEISSWSALLGGNVQQPLKRSRLNAQ